jgi:type II secretory pathway pseudopilin PulG
MKSSIVIVLVIIAILLGAIVGYYMAHISSNSMTNTVTITTTMTTTATSTITQTVTQPATLVLYSETLVGYESISQTAGSYTQYTFNLSYPGYVKVIVFSSTTTKTYVEINGYSEQGISYSTGQVDIGSSGTVSFPVLPGSVTIYIGNNNLINGATEQIEIVYYYYAPS